MMDCLVRRAKECEAQELTALALRAKAAWGYAGEQLRQWAAELSIGTELVRENLCLVAEREGQIVGCAIVLKRSSEWILDALWVEPNLFGQGVGTRLLQDAAANARQQGACRLTIDADPNAEGFYASRGACTVARVAAPIAEDPARMRPQMVLGLVGGPSS